MIVVDTSALLAVLQGEPEAEACADALDSHGTLLISAPTLTEALIVTSRRSSDQELGRLIASLPFTVVPLTEARARAAVEAYRLWGKGFHPANLGYGDCFAYALAQEHGCPLLFIGKDFAGTDATPAIPNA